MATSAATLDSASVTKIMIEHFGECDEHDECDNEVGVVADYFMDDSAPYYNTWYEAIDSWYENSKESLDSIQKLFGELIGASGAAFLREQWDTETEED